MSTRHTVDTITSDQLDALYARLDRARQRANSIEDRLASARQHRDRAEATLDRIRDARHWADVWSILGMYYGWTSEEAGQRARRLADADQQTAHTRAERAEAELSARYEADSADAAAGSYAHRAEHAERRADQAEVRAKAWESNARHYAQTTAEATARAERAEWHAQAMERRAELADAVTAETKRLMTRRTTTLRQRAEQAARRLDAIREYAFDQAKDEPHPQHDHLCPDDVRGALLALLDGDQEQAPEPEACPPGVHSLFDPCPGDCTKPLTD